MENAVEALKMAGSVLLFVLALSIVMLAFTNARESLDIILSFSDRESLTIENDSRYYYLSNSGNNLSRVVGKETIIPALYRSASENYTVVFDFKDTGRCLYTQKSSLYSNSVTENINIIDPQKIMSMDEKRYIEIINGIIYSKSFKFNNGKCEVDNTIPLNNFLNGKRFIEEIGTYYVEDLSDYDYHTIEEDTKTYGELSENNKTLKRIITYTLTNE